MDISEITASVTHDDICRLVGRVLTVTDAIAGDGAQRKAAKTLANGEIWSWWDNISNYSELLTKP